MTTTTTLPVYFGANDLRDGSKSKHHQRGAWAELIACAWLLEKGYQVFRNVAAAGSVDIVALKGRRVILIDVKTSEVGRTGPRFLTAAQTEQGVVPLYVTHEGVCSFSLEEIQAVYRIAQGRQPKTIPRTRQRFVTTPRVLPEGVDDDDGLL